MTLTMTAVALPLDDLEMFRRLASERMEVLQLRKLLIDGQWHDELQVIHRVMTAVEPGRAARRRELSRRVLNTGRGRPRPVEHDRVVQVGAREMAVDMLHQMAKHGSLERRVDLHGRKQVRLSEQAVAAIHRGFRSKPSIAILNLLVDGQWHRRADIVRLALVAVDNDEEALRQGLLGGRSGWSRERALYAGRRAITGAAMNTLVQRGDVEKRGVHPREQVEVRLSPQARW